MPYRHNKWHEPKDGWAAPLVVGGFYDVSWPSSVDFATLTLEATGLKPGEHAYVRFKHSTDWGHWKVEADGGVEKIPSVASLPGTSLATGEGRSIQFTPDAPPH